MLYAKGDYCAPPVFPLSKTPLCKTMRLGRLVSWHEHLVDPECPDSQSITPACQVLFIPYDTLPKLTYPGILGFPLLAKFRFWISS